MSPTSIFVNCVMLSVIALPFFTISLFVGKTKIVWKYFLKTIVAVVLITIPLSLYVPCYEFIIVKRIDWESLDLDEIAARQASSIKNISELEGFVNNTLVKEREINEEVFLETFKEFYKNELGACTPENGCVVLYCRTEIASFHLALIEGWGRPVNLSTVYDDRNVLKGINIWSPSD